MTAKRVYTAPAIENISLSATEYSYNKKNNNKYGNGYGNNFGNNHWGNNNCGDYGRPDCGGHCDS